MWNIYLTSTFAIFGSGNYAMIQITLGKTGEYSLRNEESLYNAHSCTPCRGDLARLFWVDNVGYDPAVDA